MDPIIKTSRISPTAFSLNRREPETGLHARQDQKKPKTELKMDFGKTISAVQERPAPAATAAPDSILTDAAIEKIVPKPVAEVALEAAETKERELREAFEKAKQDGYQAGLDAGKASAQKELEQAVGQIKELLHSLKDLNEALFQEMEDSAAEVVFEAVTKIIGQTAIDKQTAFSATRAAIEQLKGRERLIVRVSAKDYEMVKAALNDQEAAVPFATSVSVIADNLVQLGGCMIETEAGSLDARLEIQLQRLKETLLGVRKSNDDA